MDEELTTSQLEAPEPINPEPEYSEPSAENYEAPSEEYTGEDYDYQGNFTEPGAPEPEVSVDDDGEVKFSEDFFDTPNAEPLPPEYYTSDELRNIPYEQWDETRLNGDVKDFIPIVREQMQKRALMQQMAQRSQVPEYMPEVQPYTPKELADEAQKLAIQKLGLEDPDDFDEYEGEHQAALDMARKELLDQRTAQIANRQRSLGEYQNLQRFNAELAMQPDFNDFDRWFTSKVQARGLTPQQVELGFQEYAKRSGGNFAAIQGVLANWYREYQAERNGGTPQPTRRTQANRPPVLESTRGGSGYPARGGVNLRDLGRMGPDAQAEALMRMGLV